MDADLESLKAAIRRFNQERDWDQFHNPKDLVIALTSEIGELAELYRWLDPQEIARLHADPEKQEMIAAELADILTFLLILADKAGIDLLIAVKNKLEQNKKKYPVGRSKGIHSNPLEGFKGR